ncbi:MAG: methyltransferase domain-containing protein [Candidatus Andersenbacteria bacterium]
MYGWYKVKKFYPVGVTRDELWARHYEQDGQQWTDPEEYRKQLFYPLLVKYLETGKKYLDAGCSIGGWLAFLRARGYDIVGVEQSPRIVALAKRLNPTLPIQVADARHLPFEPLSFDGYLAIGTWEYAEDGTEAMAAEAARILKPGGLLVIEVLYSNPLRRWTYLPLKTLQVWWREKIMRQQATFAHHMFRKGDIHEILDQQGFTIVEENPHDLPDENSHYGLWVDWPFLRGSRPYELNSLGRLLKRLLNAASPWMIATGMFVVAKKK